MAVGELLMIAHRNPTKYVLGCVVEEWGNPKRYYVEWHDPDDPHHSTERSDTIDQYRKAFKRWREKNPLE